MKFPVFSQLTGNFGSETGSLETAPSSGESAKHQSLSGGLLALVRSLCAYDLVGFQTHQDLDGFRDYLMRCASFSSPSCRCCRRKRWCEPGSPADLSISSPTPGRLR
jgi:hypothetical protein